MRAWIGGYGPDRNGEASGISVLQAGEADSPEASGASSVTGVAVAAPGSASWLSRHPSLDVLYAALEGAGTLQAFRRHGGTTLAPLGAAVEAGEAVCHVAVSPDGSFLLASCWGDGRLVRVGLDAAGRPTSRWIAPSSSDPYGESLSSEAPSPGAVSSDELPDLAAAAAALRAAAGSEFAHLVPGYDDASSADPGAAAAPVVAASADASTAPPERVSRAHQAIWLDGGLVATTDLGFDLVRIWRPRDGGLRLVQEIALPRGSGPRHGLWHPSGHLYIITELSCELFVLAPDHEGRWSLVSGTPLGVGTGAGDTAAELAASRDRETLYAGVRGSDTIAVLRVRGSGASATPVALVESGTRRPRHHVVVRDTLLVAGQRADEIVSLPLDARTGVPGATRHRASTPSPTCILPFR